MYVDHTAELMMIASGISNLTKCLIALAIISVVQTVAITALFDKLMHRGDNE